MNNSLAGLVEISLGERTHTLRYDWNGIAEITEAYPDGYNLMDPRVLGKILQIGLRKDSPDLTIEQIMEASPPIIEAMEKVGAAINCAYFGQPKAPEETEKENPPKKALRRA